MTFPNPSLIVRAFRFIRESCPASLSTAGISLIPLEPRA